MATEKVEVYVLDVRVPKEDSRRIRVDGELSLGSDAGCDIRIRDFGLAPLQGRFRLQNNVLTFTQLGPDDSLKVGSQKCGHGRMYILDKGDKCVIDKVKLIVRKEKIEVEKEESADLNELEDDLADEPEDEGTEEHTVEANTEDATQDSILQNGQDEADESEEEGEEEDEEDFEYVEEVVYVDEDGNEVTPEKKPAFFARLFKKKDKSKEKSKDKTPPKKPAARPRLGAPTFKKGKKLRPAVAGPLYRLLGLTYNLGFFLFFYEMGLPIIKEKSGFDLLSYADKAITLLKPHLEKLPKTLPKEVAELPYVTDSYKFLKEALVEPTYYKYLIAFLAFESVFQLLLGIGLGQFLIGLYNGGNAVLKRLLGPIRAILSVLLFPFLIFDLPIIFGKRSFKEIMTFSNYAKKSLARTIFLAFVVIPLLLLIGANYQLYPAFLEKAPALTSSERDIKAPRAKKKQDKIKFSSQAFNIRGTTALAKKIRIIPSLDVKGNIISPKIVGSDLKAKYTDVLKSKTIINKDEILAIIKKDPLLPLFSPELSLAAQNLGNNKKKLPLNSEEMMKVLFYSLNLDVKNPIQNIMALGPILGPYYELKKFISSKVNARRVTIVELIHGPKGDMIHLGNSDKLASHYILRINDEGVDVINFNHTQEGQLTNKRVMEGVFFVSESSTGTYSKQINKALKKENLTERAFVVLDIFDHTIKGNKITKPEFEFILSFYAKLSLDALDNGSDDYQQILIDTFVALDKGLVRVIKKNKDKQLEILRENLNNVQQALTKRKRDTLEVNSK